MGQLLDRVNYPEDLRDLSVQELGQLAGEIREFIVETVSRTGGHLASNLGVVEVTLALHYVFDFKNDKLLWDVGHQCYAHKIITGRKEKFRRVRQTEGLSGFPDPGESPYDQFTVGHAGTSIANATGLALGQMQQGLDDKIVALVGDASIVNGASFESLNNLGLVKRQLLIVLNDNSMAIDSTQGAMAKYFSRVRLSQTYDDLRKTTSNILESFPVFGKGVEGAIERIKKSIRMVLPASQMFESLNIPYFGPVDGYDIGSLIRLFQGLSDLKHPAILHIYTTKGKGFAPAEKNRPRFHSTGPFNNHNGESIVNKTQRRSFTGVFGEHLVELAARDERIVALTSAMCGGTGLGSFREQFPGRFYDVGIAESAAVDIAAGLAKSGMKPVVAIYSTFLQRSFDQIVQEVALQGLPVVFCIDRAGVVGADGATHHGMMDIGLLRMIPEMILLSPADQVEMKSALEFALSVGRPAAVRYPKDFVPEKRFVRAASKKAFKLGRGVYVVRKKASRALIVSYGSVLREAIEAANILSREKIPVDVFNARFAQPIDDRLPAVVKKGKPVVTVEDHRLACGFGSALLEKVSSTLDGSAEGPHFANHSPENRIVMLGAPRKFISHDKRSSQLMQMGVSAEEIARKVRETVS